jgi:hypothetical protein
LPGVERQGKTHRELTMSKRLELTQFEGLPRTGWRRLPRAAALVILLLAATTGARAANFTVTVDRSTITMGESVTLTMAAEGGQPNGFPALPMIPNLQANSQGESSQITIVNGQVSSTTSETCQLTPLQPGDYTIPSLQAVINGQQFQSQPIHLKVLKAGAPVPTGNPNQPELALMRIALPKTQVYVGEVVPGELDLYLRDGVMGMQDFDLTPMQAEGFTVGKVNEGPHRQAGIGGAGYTTVPLMMSFSAVKAGKLELGPASCTAKLLLPPQDWFGRPTRSQQVSLSSDTITVTALPVPRENAPPSFNGAVGTFTMSVEVSPTNIAVGDPITVKVHITGQGGVEALTLPDQPSWQQFKQYPPTTEFQPSDQSGMSGTKSFALTVVPQSVDIKELPAFEFSYFDPDQKSFKTLTQPAVPLIVRPSAASLPVGVALDPLANAAPPSQDIVHIKPRIGAVAAIEAPLLMRPWFVTLQGLPVLAWASLWVRRRQKEKLANNPRLRRLRKAEKAIRDGLKELRQAARTNARDTFFATLFHLLQEQLGARLDLPASAITEAVVGERLGPGQVAEETRALVHELFQACNQARYARQETNDDLLQLVPKVETALRGLREGMT